ncbi:MAG: bifunctional phosphoribosylaminoimidazolecarboxamide formyltransferase/IMP cyclohydrolase [Anaerolineae bacterium]|nr:bifunctional phosphoribosylaminoimidazolecarboxamide formyltransferase/IMP cyclohydrolase [Anaerolineae bacterium]
MAVLRALISVSDKAGLAELGRGLAALGFELVASGGTAKALAAAGLSVTEVSQLTGFPEVLDGRVKTLHPAVHAGILARRTEQHLAELAAHGLAPIDVVVCNLYPFAETVARPGVTEDQAVEQIDIGGVTLLRAAAKNFESVLVLCDPADYGPALEALREGKVDLDMRRRLALKAFHHTAAYDAAIASYLAHRVEPEAGFPPVVHLTLERAQLLRYGENPHQHAALYRTAGQPPAFQQLGGKEMSYNNWLDLDAAWGLAQEFAAPTVCIIKHTNPCGVASADTLAEAYARAFASDPVSAFGGIIAVNRTADLALAEAMADLFVEVVVAPDYTEEALAKLRRKANLRILRPLPAPTAAGRPAASLRTIQGGWLVQTPDTQVESPTTWQVVTQREPTAAELADLDFAWRVAKHVKSNAIVLAKDRATVGVGAGQMSRVDSVHLAARRAGERAKGAVLASDAFFPFPDGVEAAAEAGVTAVVQPGGSVRDAEVIAACDRLGLAMCFTGVRHFRH